MCGSAAGAEPSASAQAWRGPHVGVFVGAGDAVVDGRFDIEEDDNFNVTQGLRDTVDVGLFDIAGAVGGARVGYDWAHGRFVLGIGADWTYFGAEEAGFDPDPGPDFFDPFLPPDASTDRADFELSWIASLYGRFGLASGRSLLFVTPGVAWADATYSATELDWFTKSAGSTDLSQLGFTLGAGFEHALGDGLTLRGEGRYFRFGGSKNTSALNLDSDAGDFARLEDVWTATLGLSYHFHQSDAFADAETLTDWSGFHVGASGGAARMAFDSLFDGSERTDHRDNDDSVLGRFFDPRGGAVGVHAGYTHQAGRWIVGVDGDVTFTGLSDRLFDPDPEPAENTDFASIDVDYTLSLRLRAGYASGRSVFYATGGVGYVDATYRAVDDDEPPESAGDVRFQTFGPVVGAGFEHRVTDALSISFEGLYYSFDDKQDASLLTFDSDDGDFADLSGLTFFQMGLRYRFGVGE